MEAKRWQQVQELFDAVVELRPEERLAFLDQACEDDVPLRREVESLLESERAGAYRIEEAIGEVAREIAGPAGAGTPAAGTSGDVALEGRELGPYRVIRRIGGGGMGVIYAARDTRLERDVVLKFLPPEWSRDPIAKERLLREAQAASALDHPNICTVHDVCETGDGQLYIVMARYRGETLKRTLERGLLPFDQARDLAIQVARGLERAHEAGVIHRDVKPANVFVTDRGEVKILDFGIAKLAGAAGLTRTGSSPGTPAYMSPEQAAGDRVDARTDVWSLGVILYEMLAGRRPFRGEHEQAVIHAILERDPESLDALLPEVPESLERTVMKALAKDPAARYPRVGQLLADLESGAAPPLFLAGGLPNRRVLLAAAGCLVAVLALVSWWPLRQIGPAPARPPPAGQVAEAAVPIVGVVPFLNQTGDPELDRYGQGAAQVIMENLAQSRHLRLVSATRMESLAGAASAFERAELASDRGIETLLTGEIRTGPQGYTLIFSLDDTEGGEVLAAARYQGPEPEDLFQAASDVASEARKGLGVPPTESVDVFAADFATDNPEAYGFYVQGLQAFADYRYEAAAGAFTAALERAPEFTMARYRLALIQAVNGQTHEATATIRQAVSEANRLPQREALYVRALAASIGRESDGAIDAYQQLLARYPYETEARYLLGHLLYGLGRYQQALEQVDVLIQIEPRNGIAWSLKGAANIALGHLDQATGDLRSYLALEPGSANAHHSLGKLYQARGELALAAEEYSRALEIDPAFDRALIDLAIIYMLLDQRDLCQARLTDLATSHETTPATRIKAGLELASLLRSQGRFRDAAAILERLEDLLADERVREAQALSVRGTSWMELGDHDTAARLIELALERRDRALPTRYLFARGLLELRTEQFEAVDGTVAQILGAAPAGGPYPTGDKAAAYFRGRLRLEEGEYDQAIDELLAAVTLEGYEYSVYRLSLARAYLAADELSQARIHAERAARQRDLTRPRMDLELDRVRAQLLLAQIKEAMELPVEAAAHAREFLERWANADPGLAELVEARRLADAGPRGLP